MKFQVSAFVVLVSWLDPCSAWGTLGHETIAYIASNFVTSATKAYFQAILSDTSDSYLASVAAWADTYRYTAAGEFSAPYHYIDAEDNPPTTCGVVYSRDCGRTGCVVAAINNYFIIHFIGDIHQPLHDENLDVGGNDISVLFAGKTANLHAVWDTSIPQTIAGGNSLAIAKTWAANLTTTIKKTKTSTWLNKIALDDPITTAMEWATDANSYVCTNVIPDGVSAVKGDELDSAYYTTNAPVVELLISKAGYRLAAWLNLIATGSTSL